MSKDVDRTQVLQNVRVRHALKKDGSWIHKSKDDKTDHEGESKPAMVRQKSYVLQTAKRFESVDSSPTSPPHQTAFLPSKGDSANQANGEVDKAQGELQLEKSTVEAGADTKSPTSTDQLSQNSLTQPEFISIPDTNSEIKKEENSAPVDELNVEHSKEGVEISVDVEENIQAPSSATEDSEAVSSVEPAEQPPANKSAEDKKELVAAPTDISNEYHSEAKVSTDTNVESSVTVVSDVGSTAEGNDTVEVPVASVAELKPQEETLLETEPTNATNLMDASTGGSSELSPPQKAEEDIVATATKVMVECETNDEAAPGVPGKDVAPGVAVATGEDAAPGDVATEEVKPGDSTETIQVAPEADAPVKDVATDAAPEAVATEEVKPGEDDGTGQDTAPGEYIATREDAAPGEDVATEEVAPGVDAALRVVAPGEAVSTGEVALEADASVKAVVTDAAPGENVATEEVKPEEAVSTGEVALEADASVKDVATDAAPGEDVATEEEKPGEDVATEEEKPGEDVATEEEKPGDVATEEEKPGEDASVQVVVDSVPDLLVESVCKSSTQPAVETSAEGSCERFPPDDHTKETVEAVNEVEVKSLPVTAVDEATPGGEAPPLNVEPDPHTILEPPAAEPAIQSVESEVEIASSAEPVLKSSAVEIIECEAQCVDIAIVEQSAEPTPEVEPDHTMELNIEDAVKPVSDSDAESVKVNVVERAINLTDALDIEAPTAEAAPEPVENPEQSLPEESGLKQQCDATNSSEEFQKPAEEPRSTETTGTPDGKASCSVCNQIIDGNVKISFSEPPVAFHPECLKCGVCAKALGDLLTSMFLHDKVIQCGGCFSKTLNI